MIISSSKNEARKNIKISPNVIICLNLESIILTLLKGKMIIDLLKDTPMLVYHHYYRYFLHNILSYYPQRFLLKLNVGNYGFFP
jgi:hypothetical protein